MGHTFGGSTMQHVGARVCQKLSARKLLYGLKYNPRMLWDAVSRRRMQTTWGGEETALTLGTMVTLGTAHAPHNLASASGQWTLPDGSRAGSLPFQGQSRIAKQKRSEREKLAKCISWCWKQPSRRAAPGSSRFCWKKGENPFSLIRE